MTNFLIGILFFVSCQSEAQEVLDIKVEVFVDSIKIDDLVVELHVKTDSTIYSITQLKAMGYLDSNFYNSMRGFVIPIGMDSIDFFTYHSYMEQFFEWGINQYRNFLTDNSRTVWKLEINHYPFTSREEISEAVNEHLYSDEFINKHAERLKIPKEEIVNCVLFIGQGGTSSIAFREGIEGI